MRVAITGAAGQLGTELARAFTDSGSMVIPLVRPTFSLERPSLPHGIDVVVNAAAWTDVDGCARDPERAMLLNGAAAGRLAQLARDASAAYVQISTNEVFDGADERSYGESDDTRPINAYGTSKLAGEVAVRAAHPAATIVRTAWIHGGPRSFPTKILAVARRLAEDGRILDVVADEVGNPTPAGLLAERVVTLLTRGDPLPLVIHLAGDPPISRHDWAAQLLAEAGLPPPRRIALRDYVRDSTPPAHAVLDTSLARSIGLGISWQAWLPG